MLVDGENKEILVAFKIGGFTGKGKHELII